MLARIFAWTGRRTERKSDEESDATAPSSVPPHSPEESSSPDPIAVPARPIASFGVMDAPQLQDFLAANHFGLGVHNGANLRTRDSLDQGKAELVAKFCNVVTQLSQQTQVRLNRLRDKETETAGVCATTTERLQLASRVAEKEIATYVEQAQLATRELGWVAEPLLKYQMGFRKGLADALEFELLGR